MRRAVSGRLSPGEMMKIYMLMVLIGAIAAMSHLSSERAGSLITAAFRARRRTSDDICLLVGNGLRRAVIRFDPAAVRAPPRSTNSASAVGTPRCR